MSVSLQGNGPLAEIEFWRERNATLSALHEQTKLPLVRKVLEVIKESDSLLVANLQPVLTDLFKLHMEASDNVRFLSTVERHFKVRRGHAHGFGGTEPWPCQHVEAWARALNTSSLCPRHHCPRPKPAHPQRRVCAEAMC